MTPPTKLTRQIFISEVIRKHPSPVMSRPALCAMSGGLIGIGAAANRDCAGTGPADRVRMGRRVGYVTASAAAWLADELGLTDD